MSIYEINLFFIFYYLLNHELIYFGVGNFSFLQAFALSLAVVFLSQILSGLFLVSILDSRIEVAWTKLQFIIWHNWYFWLIRDFHMLNANLVMFLIYAHFFKGIASTLNPTRKLVWITGAFILLIALGLCFTGYVLVFGQMSYWALIVILNLITIFPIFDTLILEGIYGGNYVNSTTTGRILTMHFLMGLIALFLLMLHLISIHRSRPAGFNFLAADGRIALGDVITKDLIFLIGFIIFVLLSGFDKLIHPDNYGCFSRLVTPAHIEPEVYFLYLFFLYTKITFYKNSRMHFTFYDQYFCSHFYMFIFYVQIIVYP